MTRALAAALGVLLTVAVATAQSSATGAATESRRITDATGRSIALPSKVERVFAAGPPASVLIFALAPDKPIGWPRAPHPDEVPFLPERAAALPALGRLTGRGNTANVEVVMRAKPDVIIDIGSTPATRPKRSPAMPSGCCVK